MQNKKKKGGVRTYDNECLNLKLFRLVKRKKKSCHRSKSKSLPTNVASCDHQSIITIKIHKAGSDKRRILNKKGLTKLI